MNQSFVRAAWPAIAASAMAVLPVPLVGGLAILLQADIPFGEARLGLATAGFFAAAAIAAAPAGRLSESIGPRAVAWVGLACIVTSLLGIALLTQTWEMLAVFLAIAGVGHSMTILAVGVLITRSVRAGRLGLAFGIAQAAAPLASLLAGLSVPFVGLVLGWRVAFLFGAVLAVVVAFVVPASQRPSQQTALDTSRDAPKSALAPLAIGMALASAGANSSAVFLVASAADNGLTAVEAGLMLAIASLVAVGVRVSVGWLGDRLVDGSLRLMALLIALGAAGYAGLAFSPNALIIVACAVLAFGGGWGWPGLMLLAVSRSNPGAPGVAMGYVTVGGLSGGVIGPLVFGLLAERIGFAASWLTMTVVALSAASLVMMSRQRILRARPGAAT